MTGAAHGAHVKPVTGAARKKRPAHMKYGCFCPDCIRGLYMVYSHVESYGGSHGP
jgi:hypothetical protein